jgi:hypothetical protein
MHFDDDAVRCRLTSSADTDDVMMLADLRCIIHFPLLMVRLMTDLAMAYVCRRKLIYLAARINK